MICWARYLFILVVVVLALGQMIAACGQKGDLYIAEPETPGKQRTPAPSDGSVPEVQTGESLEIQQEISEADQPPPRKAN